MTSELELITAAVTGAFTGGAVRPLLAPFEAVSEHWKTKILQRLQRVDERAHGKALGRPLVINERVAFKALTEAAFTDDELVTDYLAGVLAASSPQDDTGAAMIAQIARLSGLQLRVHYLAYRALWIILEQGSRVGGGIGVNDLRDDGQLAGAQLFLPGEAFTAALELPPSPAPAERIASICRVLVREDLLGSVDLDAQVVATPTGGRRPAWLYDSANNLGMRFARQFPDRGLVYQATPAGIELFLWGCGSTDHDPVALRGLAAELVEQIGLPACPGELVDRLPTR